MSRSNKASLLTMIIALVIFFLILSFLLIFKNVIASPQEKTTQGLYPSTNTNQRLADAYPFPETTRKNLIFPYPPPVSPTAIPNGNEKKNKNTDIRYRDAEMYASQMGVSLDEAIKRLEFQDIIGKLKGNLIEKESDSFAGLWIQHQPNYQIMVQFTHDGKSTLQPYITDSPIANMIEIRQADFSLKDLENDRARLAKECDALGIQVNTDINVQENSVELSVLDPGQIYDAVKISKIILPSKLRLIKVKELAKNVSSVVVQGGMPTETCTTGFSVKDSTGVKGVTLAAHCEGDQLYNWYGEWFLLPMRWQRWGNGYDIRWNSAELPFLFVANIVYDGYSITPRFITSVKFRADQSVGEYVCKYGKVTGFFCGTIVSTSFDGMNVRVDIPTIAGDSGGPWFHFQVAYGTTISRIVDENGNVYGSVYGPVDQIITGLNISIMTGQVYLPLVIK